MTDLIAIYPKDPQVRATHSGARGDYGELVAPKTGFACGFLFRIGFVRLPVGIYEAEFSRMGAKRDGVRCIRVLTELASFALTDKQREVLDADSLCIHPAQFVDQLKGCQAPGRHRDNAGWAAGDSTTTLGGLFDALGGHRMGVKLVLEVRDG